MSTPTPPVNVDDESNRLTAQIILRQLGLLPPGQPPPEGSVAAEENKKWGEEYKAKRNAEYNRLEEEALKSGAKQFQWEGHSAYTRSRAERERLGIDKAQTAIPAPDKPDAAPASAAKPDQTATAAPVQRTPQVVVRRPDGSFTLADPDSDEAKSPGQAEAIEAWKKQALLQQAERKPDKGYSGLAPVQPGQGQSGNFDVREGQGAYSPGWSLSSAAVVNDPSKPKDISYGIDIAKAVQDPGYASKIRQQLSPLQKELFEEEFNKTQAHVAQSQQIAAQAAQLKMAEDQARLATDPAYRFQRATEFHNQFRQEVLKQLQNTDSGMYQKYALIMEAKQKELDADKKLSPQERLKQLSLYGKIVQDQLTQQAISIAQMQMATANPESLQAQAVASARGGQFPMLGVDPNATATK